MSSPDILQAQLRELEAQRNEALRDGDAALVREIDQEISTTRENLRTAERANTPADARFVGQDPIGGGFRYQNQVTGEIFLSTRPPSAAQQAAFDAANPPPAPQPAPPATAAQTAQDDAPQGPTAPPAQTVGTDGRIVPPAETGTDAALKTTETTQAINTNSSSGQATPAPGTTGATAAQSGTATLSPGVAAAKDDAAQPIGLTGTDAQTAAEPTVKPRPNVLDQYASYSYSASVYLLTETQYARMLNSATKTVDGYQLLFQSGGAANNVGGIRPPASFDDTPSGTVDGARNPYFDNDFYIDSITIENLPPGKSTGSAHNISSLKFTVIEPLGITLLDRLYDAVANSEPRGGDGKVNYTAATYLMVIRFYGYDSEGNLEQVRSKSDAEGTSDSAAIVEKFFPFKIRAINWGVGTKLVSYEWDCVPIGQMIAGFASRGTIPYDVQLVDSTVGGLLGGDVAFSTAAGSAANPGESTTADPRFGTRDDPRQGRGFNANTAAPQKANAAPSDKKAITRGLVGAMNQFQAKLVQDGVFKYADEYVVKFIGPDANKIRDARLQLPNTKVVKRLTAAGDPATKDAQALDQARTSVDMVSRTFSITAGQQLLQAIELTIRNSSYIYDQAVVIINPDGTQIPNPNARNKPLKWFVITMTAERISPELDPKRNDYAYRITYSIAAREVKNMISKYFPVSRFSGVHKSYPYWFTGKNIAVLEYEETLNALYQLTVSGSAEEASAVNRIREKFTSSMSDILTYNYAPRSTESSSGASGKENELGANAAEVLYSPGDLRESKVKIIGDPAWIMQGSNFRIPDQEFTVESITSGFGPDGSISFDNQDVLYEISWQRPEDYDIDTGVADPYSQTQKKYNNRTALQSRVYLCKRVTSEFRQGRFEQTLEGALYLFPVPDRSNTANPAAADSLVGTDEGRPVNPEVGRVDPAIQNILRGRANPELGQVDPAIQNILRNQTNSAANLGAQSGARTVPIPGTLGSGSYGAVGTFPVTTGQLGSGTFSIENAPLPLPPTSGTGGAITTVPAGVPQGPRKLPASGTDAQVAARQLQETIQESRTGPGTDPVSSSNPIRQLRARDF